MSRVRAVFAVYGAQFQQPVSSWADSLDLMALQAQRYTLCGFSPELNWRPLSFVEPIPTHKVCDVCGFLPNKTVFMPCRHVLCKTCYEQCLVNEVHECPLDSVQFREEDAQWMSFPAENLLTRKVKCWNEDNGCEASVNVSDLLKHFDEDCVHHSTRCPNCSALVLRANVCAHRSNCSAHALSNKAPHREPLEESVQGAMFTALEAVLEERIKEVKCHLDQVVRNQNTHCDRISEVSHIVNALRETFLHTSQKQTEAGIVAVGQVKEDLAAQGGRLDEVARRIGALGEHVKAVAEASRQCLEILEQSDAERRRPIAGDNRLERTSETMTAFEGVLGRALERATETILQNFKTYVDLSGAAKAEDAETGHKASGEKENQLLRQKNFAITRHGFCVKEIEALKEEALSTGNARSCCEPVYLCGYRISPGLYLQANESSVLVHTRIQLYKGVNDEFLEWPFCHNVKLTFMHPSSDKKHELLNITPFDLESFRRPAGANTAFYWYSSLGLEDLEREGYVECDELCVKYEILPPTA